MKTVNNLIFDVNFAVNCAYVAKNDSNGNIMLFGITLLPFKWDGWGSFGRNNLSADSKAFFKYLDDNSVIESHIDAATDMFNLTAVENRPILFYGVLKAE